jgi:hypothetical protein
MAFLNERKTNRSLSWLPKDHIDALACGGADAVSNMQWQTVAAARAKDCWERKACAR